VYQSSQPDNTPERRFFHATGIVMVLGTMISGAILLWLATHMQSPAAPAQFAVYGRGDDQSARLEAGGNMSRETSVVFLEATPSKLEAATEIPNMH
jgi:hypothetical protein